MKTAKKRTGTKPAKVPPSGRSGSPKAVDLTEIRQRITTLVGTSALGMVETTIEEVGKGHYLGMKYLFEMIGLYPATATDEAPIQDSLAATLLRHLGLPETPIPEPKVTKDSETPAAAKDDSLE